MAGLSLGGYDNEEEEYNDLFRTGDERQERQPQSSEPIRKIEISNLTKYPNHRFKVIDNEDMKKLVASIQSKGVMEPVIVRPYENGYQILAGHRRIYAAESAGLSVVPAIVKRVNDEDAKRIMLHTNLHRPFFYPSEMAWFLRMEQELEGNFDVGKNQDSLNKSRASQFRYIRLTYLKQELLELVDEKKLGVIAGASISYLSDAIQSYILTLIQDEGIKISSKAATSLKEKNSIIPLTEYAVDEIISQFSKSTKGTDGQTESEKDEAKYPSEIRKHFDETISDEEMTELIILALEEVGYTKR